jgi:branched-chain amino acid transport system substrate-binding protein
MKMKKYTLGVVVLILVSLLLPLCAVAKERPPVRIGLLYPITGGMAAVGREGLRAAEIAADMVNERGGIWNGRKIELVTGDAADAEAARTETERLCTVEKVKCILGVYSSSLAFVAHPIANKYGVFFWESNAIAPRLRQMGHKYTFFFGPPAREYGYGSARVLAEVVCPTIGVKPQDLRIAAVYQGTEWGKGSTSEAFIPKAKELGMNIVLDSPYDPKSLDFTPLVQKIKMLNPDVVEIQAYIDDGIRFFRDARKNALNPKVWVGNGAVFADVPEAFEKFGSDMNYYLSTNQVAGGNIWNLSPSTQVQYREFLKRYKQKYGKEMLGDTVVIWTAAIALFEYILPAAGSLDPDKLAAAAYDLSLAHTHTARPGGIKFAPADAEYGNQNIRGGVMVRQIFNGKHYAIWPTEIAEIKVKLPSPPFGQREISAEEVKGRLLIPDELLEY